MDPERLIQCPLVKHHQIRARRFPYHLVKCKESNPEIAKKLATCPFNARHLVPQADLSDHIMKCNDKAFMDPFLSLPPKLSLSSPSNSQRQKKCRTMPHCSPDFWPLLCFGQAPTNTQQLVS
uniref:Gametocyte specific factor 1 n=1 Tax=Zosterops lateralis melanops TaxID=1220523 RepID=A0A8D2PSV1_ZOSLA